MTVLNGNGNGLASNLYSRRLDVLRNKRGFICDMDGVIYRGGRLIPGAKEFVNWLQKERKEFIFLTNNSAQSPKTLRLKLLCLGLDIDERHFYTAGQATAKFLSIQKPGARCYVIGEKPFFDIMEKHGLVLTDQNPDYVVMGEGASLTFANVSVATQLVLEGARLIGTNPDTNCPAQGGTTIPAVGAMISVVEIATGKKAFMCGKPHSLTMEAELENYAFQPFIVLEGVKDIAPQTNGVLIQ
ncbi:hypothetical protein IWQ60_006085 [Tieghemiomyces parasiticus]|uniref:4-nitrophenylphosphatase n=1 Tax=Tieghemiomyces parasiticus TaxID=78921 RepID=A0A9W8DXX5_9FUNG|nr:hypothetical protein IWQ60_006085 [Tieghemiomyces parasiticus]